MEEILMQILAEIKGLNGKVDNLTTRVDSLTNRVDKLTSEIAGIKSDLKRLEQKLDVVHLQTGNLTEFANETDRKIKRHDLDIEVLKRAIAN